MRKLISLLMSALLSSALLSGCTRLPEARSDIISVYASTPHIYAMAKQLLTGVEGVRLSCLTQPSDGLMSEHELNEWELYLLAYDADIFIASGSGYESYISSLAALGEACPVIIDASAGIETSGYSESGEETNEGSYIFMAPTTGVLMMNNIALGLISSLGQGEELISSNLEEAVSFIDSIKEAAFDPIGKLEYAVLCTGLECFLDETGARTVYRYDRAPGTSISYSELNTVCDDIVKSGADAVLIENYAPDSLVDALGSHGIRIIRLDLMESSNALETPYTKLLENNINALTEALPNE